MKFFVFLAIICSFISTNIYWLLTLFHVKEVVDMGETSVLTGLKAAKYLLQANGFEAYLDNMGSFYVVCFACCAIGSKVIAYRDIHKLKSILKNSVLCLFFAMFYYLWTLNIYIFDRVADTSYVISGFEAFYEVNFLQFISRIVGIWILFFFTNIICKALICLKHKPRNYS